MGLSYTGGWDRVVCLVTIVMRNWNGWNIVIVVMPCDLLADVLSGYRCVELGLCTSGDAHWRTTFWWSGPV